MNVSPQSQSALDKLLQGEEIKSGDLTIGPLDQQARTLLRVLIDYYEDLCGRKGTDQARSLRRAFGSLLQSALRHRRTNLGDVGHGESETQEASHRPRTPIVSLPLGWRLFRMQCQSIRGIAPPGETFVFSFDGVSTLLFGPNASGKSSLLAAVIWCIAGRTMTDATEVVETSPLYGIPNTSGRATKLRDWPVIHTLPVTGNPRNITPDCWVQLELRSADGSRHLHLRRSLLRELEVSSDAIMWSKCSSLDVYGIRPPRLATLSLGSLDL